MIHIAGTKGKGSTCAFTRSFLQVHSERTGFPKRIGLYTSPHLQVVCERIQVDFRPIQKDLFTRYFFEVWNRVISQVPPNPRYLQLLMLVAVHTFIKEKVDVAIFEAHNGGEYDATNIFASPKATGISTIGMDHVGQLGPSIENIAWHKAGIFKTGSSAFSVDQQPQAAAVLRSRANEKKVSLEFIGDDLVNNMDAPSMKTVVQRRNASLALKLANSFLQKQGGSIHLLTPDDIKEAVQHFSWSGRFQQIVRGTHKWFLDGAHNELSVPYAVRWFAEMIKQEFRLLSKLFFNLDRLLIHNTVLQDRFHKFSFLVTILNVMEQQSFEP